MSQWLARFLILWGISFLPTALFANHCDESFRAVAETSLDKAISDRIAPNRSGWVGRILSKRKRDLVKNLKLEETRTTLLTELLAKIERCSDCNPKQIETLVKEVLNSHIEQFAKRYPELRQRIEAKAIQASVAVTALSVIYYVPEMFPEKWQEMVRLSIALMIREPILVPMLSPIIDPLASFMTKRAWSESPRGETGSLEQTARLSYYQSVYRSLKAIVTQLALSGRSSARNALFTGQLLLTTELGKAPHRNPDENLDAFARTLGYILWDLRSAYPEVLPNPGAPLNIEVSAPFKSFLANDSAFKKIFGCADTDIEAKKNALIELTLDYIYSFNPQDFHEGTYRPILRDLLTPIPLRHRNRQSQTEPPSQQEEAP